MITNKQGRSPIYESAFKIVIAREYLTGKESYGTLAKKYGLPGAKTVEWFVKWYKRNYPLDVHEGEHKAAEAAAGNSNEKQLSRRLKEANLKIAGLEMLIETAQKELGIDLVKKPGTKQS